MKIWNFKSIRQMAALAIVIAFSTAALAADHAIMVRSANVYLSPDASTQKLAQLERGREVIIIERSNQWAHVLATISQQFGEDRDISGWVVDKGLITANTPKGDQIMYGEAVESENEASQRGGRKGAAADARRLYFRTSEYFPKSPLAGESLYRAADIQWQIDREDALTRKRRPSDLTDRPQIDDQWMKMVKKKFPQTKWADLAEFHLIENKLCYEWQAQAKCPEKEAGIYEKYAKDHPGSPTAAEALYNAAMRYAALIEMYKNEGEGKKSPEAAQKAIAAAQAALGKNASGDWNARAERLIYMVQNHIPAFGNAVE